MHPVRNLLLAPMQPDGIRVKKFAVPPDRVIAPSDVQAAGWAPFRIQLLLPLHRLLDAPAGRGEGLEVFGGKARPLVAEPEGLVQQQQIRPGSFGQCLSKDQPVARAPDDGHAVAALANQPWHPLLGELATERSQGAGRKGRVADAGEQFRGLARWSQPGGGGIEEVMKCLHGPGEVEAVVEAGDLRFSLAAGHPQQAVRQAAVGGWLLREENGRHASDSRRLQPVGGASPTRE